MSSALATIDHSTARQLVSAGLNPAAEVVGLGKRWGVRLRCGEHLQTLTATRGQPKTFARFETLAAYLKDLGIFEFKVNTTGSGSNSSGEPSRDRRSAAASARMKHAHHAAAYDRWFRAQVQASIDDPRSSVGDAEARAQFAAKRADLGVNAAVQNAAKA